MDFGVDVMTADRIRLFHERMGDKGLHRVFQTEEIEVLESGNGYERLAARFAAKEALMKALGRRIDFRHIVIRGGGDQKPYAVLKRADGLEQEYPVSFSHQDGYCVAMCVIAGEVQS